jgi:hypothetical protein
MGEGIPSYDGRGTFQGLHFTEKLIAVLLLFRLFCCECYGTLCVGLVDNVTSLVCVALLCVAGLLDYLGK